MRTITVTGHIAADAQMLVSKTGNEYMSFRIGSNEFNDKKDGAERTYWFRVTCSNKTYFNLVKFLTKGRSVIVSGDYKDDIYQNNAGQCDISRDIFANAIYFNSNGQQSANGISNTATPTEQSTVTQVTTQTVMTSESTADIQVPKKRTTKKKEEEVNVQATTNDVDEDELPF